MEQQQGFDPEVKKYFRKIMSTFGAGFLWLFANITAGMYLGLAYVHGNISLANVLYYLVSILTLALLLRFYYKLWKK